MKVAFWNGVSSTDGVTDYLAAIGTILALQKKCQIVLGSNHISNHMLQDCFAGRIKEEGIAHTPYRFFYGSPAYFRALWDIQINRQGPILEKPMEGITIIYPPDVTDKHMFYLEVPRTVLYLLDIAGENNAASQSALAEAEIVVVFLPQDVTEIHKFFDRFSSLIPKALFVIEGVRKGKGTFQNTLKLKYGINSSDIGIIPHNYEYIEACEEGRLDFFIKSTLKHATRESQKNFIQGLKSVANLLYERCISELEKEWMDEQDS